MKIMITYEFNADYYPFAYWAKGNGHKACGENYEDAKKRLLDKLWLVSDVPPSEEVEI